MPRVSGEKPYIEPESEKRVTRSQTKKQAQTKKVDEAAKAKKALHSLNLDVAKIAKNRIAEVISHFPHITSLSLKDCDLDDELCTIIAWNCRKELQDIQELFLGNNPQITGEGLLEFLSDISPHKINVSGSTSIRVEDIDEDRLAVFLQQQVLAHKALQDISSHLKDKAWEERVDLTTLGLAKQAILMMDSSSVEAFLASFPQAQAQYQKDLKNYFIKTALPELIDSHEKMLVSLFVTKPVGDHKMETDRSLSPTTEISDRLSQLSVSESPKVEDSDTESDSDDDDDDEDSDAVKVKDTLEEMMPGFKEEVLKEWTQNGERELSSLLTPLLTNLRGQAEAVHELAIEERAFSARTDQERRKVDSLILETGICYGFCLDYASKKLQGDERELTERTGKKRFYQALMDVAHSPRWRDDAREAQLKKIEGAVQELDQLFSGKESSIYEKCKKVYEVVLLQAAAVGDFVLKRKLEKELKEFKQVQKPVAQCRLKLQELLKKQRELNAILEAQKKAVEHAGVDEKVLKKLGFSITERKIEPAVKVENFASLKRLIQEIGTEHAMFTFQEEKKDEELSPFTTGLYHKIALIAGLEPKEDSKELIAQLQSIPKEQLKTAVDTFKAKELERYVETVAKRRLGESAPDLVLNGVKKKLTDECDEAISALLGEKEDEEDELTNPHAVYFHVKPPYSIKDPNYPNLEFETNDLATFLIYIGIWSALNSFTHITEIQSITQR